ncbi:MAG: hypothetical protein M0D57_03515 [Sphingobacteriales bacterium JAD_PAG50586_3]|nr:MAG: hypothetical protein M0D57_03515 [Sphingobacteriales bacterium JAD_PAG50586_3]
MMPTKTRWLLFTQNNLNTITLWQPRQHQGNNSGITGHADIEINAQPAIVWDALTNPAKVKQYFLVPSLKPIGR